MVVSLARINTESIQTGSSTFGTARHNCCGYFASRGATVDPLAVAENEPLCAFVVVAL